jgi:hypothetical protein
VGPAAVRPPRLQADAHAASRAHLADDGQDEGLAVIVAVRSDSEVDFFVKRVLLVAGRQRKDGVGRGERSRVPDCQYSVSAIGANGMAVEAVGSQPNVTAERAGVRVREEGRRKLTIVRSGGRSGRHLFRDLFKSSRSTSTTVGG